MTEQTTSFVDLGITRQDGRTRLDFDNRMLTATPQMRTAKDGTKVATGVTVWKLKYSEAVKDIVELGKGLAVVNEDGSVMNAGRVMVTFETRDEAALAAKRAAEGTANFLKVLRRRLGLSVSKQKVADGDKLMLSDLQDWVAGKRQIIKRQFDELDEKAQAEVRKMAERLAAKAAKSTMVKMSAVEMMRLQLAEGKFDDNTERKAAAEAWLTEHDARAARLKAGKQTPAERNRAKMSIDESDKQHLIVRGEVEAELTEQAFEG